MVWAYLFTSPDFNFHSSGFETLKLNRFLETVQMTEYKTVVVQNQNLDAYKRVSTDLKKFPFPDPLKKRKNCLNTRLYLACWLSTAIQLVETIVNEISLEIKVHCGGFLARRPGYGVAFAHFA